LAKGNFVSFAVLDPVLSDVELLSSIMDPVEEVVCRVGFLIIKGLDSGLAVGT
jgi:hypothetical protein